MVGLILAAAISVIVGIISFLWVEGIDNMKQNHPDYKGKDFLDFGNEDE
jgi:predicted outer membrane lipoprotein